ncbi:hypothetical protein VTK73DRAFT_6608 [Phialemonium thermophilum]|uniref:Uncharacterized protein n=1 Tax=Phialemonium thermophilum TaxID=223376 RepID=A0ABR3WIS7_9PEZI
MSRDLDVRGLGLDVLQCPITALVFFTAVDGRLYVLAGEDGWLKVYDVDKLRLCSQIRIFSSQAIHGIRISSARLIVWGGQSIATLSTGDLQAIIAGNRVNGPVVAMVSDRIYDGSLSPHDESRGVFITAHNEIMPFFIEPDRSNIRFGELVSPSRPILYSAAVSWTAQDVVLVAAGTVFGEIVVWECNLEESKSSQILFVLTGHEGSIFGVAISPDMELVSGSRRKLLATCSDDRTIRVWDITKDQGLPNAGNEGYSKVLRQARETGFNSGCETGIYDDLGASRCLAVAMGHLSRIWHVAFPPHDENHTRGLRSEIDIYSFGEDATAQKWHLHLDAPVKNASSMDSGQRLFPGRLENVEKFLCHSGKHIWSVAMTRVGMSGLLTATGGADSRISLLSSPHELLSLPDTLADSQGQSGCHIVDHSNIFSFEGVIQSLPTHSYSLTTDQIISKGQKKAKDGFLRYAFLSQDQLLVSTSSGRLLLGLFKPSLSWIEVDIPNTVREDLRTYNVVKSLGNGAALLGSSHGRVYLFRELYGIQEVLSLTGKVADLLRLPRPFVGVNSPTKSVCEPGWTYSALVTTLGGSHAILLTISTAGQHISVHRLPLMLERGIVTAVSLCGNTLVVGTRTGYIALYEPTPAGEFVFKTSRSDCRTKDAVSSILVLPPIEGQEPSGFIATFRDGHFRIYEFSRHRNDIHLHLRHEVAPPLGPIIEGAWFTKAADGDLELIIFGFRSNSFVVWNETRQQEIAAVLCGGAHRNFDYVSNAGDAAALRFVFTKASHMGIYSQSQMRLQTLKYGGHGREIRAVAASETNLATGAEDTCIRVWSFDEGLGPNTLRCRAVLGKHSTGIQCLKWHGNAYLLSSAGNEELFVWRVSKLVSAYKGLAVVCEAVWHDRSRDGDLRITNFDVVPSQSDSSGMIISLALSNSSFKTYFYSPKSSFRLLASGKYTGACLTQIRHLRAPGNATMFLLTTSTDGYVALWKDTSSSGVLAQEAVDSAGDYTTVQVMRLHQSTIKCLDLRVYSNGARPQKQTWQVITGGDDNVLGVMDLTWTAESNSLTILGGVRVRTAHATAVTGLAISQKDDKRTTVVTVSNDQRIKMWCLHRTEGGTSRVALIGDQYSAIADPGDVELVSPGQLMLVGVGMELWSC